MSSAKCCSPQGNIMTNTKKEIEFFLILKKIALALKDTVKMPCVERKQLQPV